MGVNGRMKLVGRWPKREEPLKNIFREEVGLPITDTWNREWSCNWQSKRMADRRWEGERLGNDFEGNKIMFWKEET